jgi:hypothetical protein
MWHPELQKGVRRLLLERRGGAVTTGEVRQEANSSELKTRNLNGGGKEREAFFA